MLKCIRCIRQQTKPRNCAGALIARPTSRYICLKVRKFRLMLVLFYIYIYIYIYIYSSNIPPIGIINRICENQNLLSL